MKHIHYEMIKPIRTTNKPIIQNSIIHNNTPDKIISAIPPCHGKVWFGKNMNKEEMDRIKFNLKFFKHYGLPLGVGVFNRRESK